MNKTKGKVLPSCNYSKNQEKKKVYQMGYHCHSEKWSKEGELRSAGREWLNLILNSKIREDLTEKGTVEQSLKEMRIRHKDI